MVLSYTDDILKTATANGSGDYSFSVSPGWTGTVTLSKTGYAFTPSHTDYTLVTTNQTQDYTATLLPVVVQAGGNLVDGYSIASGHGQQDNYPGVNDGPAKVTNTLGGSVVSSVRVLYGASSYSEMMGYPNNTTTAFWFPWYNNTAMDSQLRVSNVGVATTTITVYLAGSQIDSFDLGAGVAIRKNYAGQNSGPMRVTSSDGVPILSTIRVLWGTSLSEMMGYPNDATTDFWFPWYDNVGTDAQLRVGNLGGSTTTVTVHLDGSQIDSFDLGASAGIRKNYPGLNSGALHVTSSGGVPILSTLRLLYAGTSFYELMGYPASALTGTQYFPWYNNTAMDSQMRIAVP